MIVYFYKTGEMDGRSSIKIPLRSSAILNIRSDDKYCFLWSLLAYLHPCNSNHLNRVTNYEQYFNELNIEGFNFRNGFKCSDVHRFIELTKLSKNIFELNFYEDQSKWIHKLILIEISKYESERVIDILIYKNHYVLLKKLHIFLGNHKSKYLCSRCLNPYTSQNVLIKHKQRCGEQDITSLRLNNEFHLYRKNHFQKNRLYFRFYADFEE